MKNNEIGKSQGDIRRLWAESFDKEMDRFLLMPADDLFHVLSPMNSQPVSLQSQKQSFCQRTLARIRRSLWRLALKSIVAAHVGGDEKSSQVVDHCLGLQDLLAESNGR